MNKSFFLFFLLLFPVVNIFAQEKEILKLLNRELKKEIKLQQMAEPQNERWEIVQDYQIENGLLSVAVKKWSSDKDTSFYIERQEVPLKDIVSISRDINVLFVTQPNAVKTSRKENGRHSESFFHLFFLHLSLEKQNRLLGNQLVKAFKKAGYRIHVDGWFN